MATLTVRMARPRLHESAVLGQLNADARALIERRGVIKRFKPRAVLWRAGDAPRGLYVIIEGCVRILGGDETRQHVVHTAAAGATIGEVPLFDGGMYPATAMAQTATTCLFLDRQTILSAIQKDPTLALTLLSRLSQRVRYLVDQLRRSTLMTVRSRLASHLIRLVRAENGLDVARLERSQAELAEHLGTVREVLARELATLRRYGIVRSLGYRAMEILDIEALRRLALGRVPLTPPNDVGE